MVVLPACLGSQKATLSRDQLVSISGQRPQNDWLNYAAGRNRLRQFRELVRIKAGARLERVPVDQVDRDLKRLSRRGWCRLG